MDFKAEFQSSPLPKSLANRNAFMHHSTMTMWPDKLPGPIASGSFSSAVAVRVARPACLSPLRWASMRLPHVLVAVVLLSASGCRNRDALALQAYTNIPPGSVIILRTKANVTDGTSLPPRKFVCILTNECVLEEIKDGCLMVSNFNGGRLSFAGSIVKSIVVKQEPTLQPGAGARP
jgi:hypothetical protein